MRSESRTTQVWRTVVARSARATLRVSPWLWLATLVPVAFEGRWSWRAVGGATAVTLVALVFVFAIGIGVQALPRNWFR